MQAVQTLSRLNRMIPGKDAPFVLDFVNDAENIFRAFKPYYDKTDLAQVRHGNGQRSANLRKSAHDALKSPLHSAFHSR